MKRAFSSVFASGIVLLVLLGCQDKGVSPQKEVPEPEIVPYTAIPQPFINNMYFFYGAGLEDAAVPVLEELLQADFDINDAWYPEWENSGECMVVLVDQLIVRLEAPDERIFDFGLVSDSSQIFLSVCIPTWKHYRFD